MNDKETFDASDMTWKNVGQWNKEMNTEQIKHIVLYKDAIPPKRFQKLNPFAWINYWRKKRSNLIAYVDMSNGEDESIEVTLEVQEDGTIHIIGERKIE